MCTRACQRPCPPHLPGQRVVHTRNPHNALAGATSTARRYVPQDIGFEFESTDVDGSPEGQFITAGDKGELRVWNMSSGECVHTEKATSPITNCFLDPRLGSVSKAVYADEWGRNRTGIQFNSGVSAKQQRLCGLSRRTRGLFPKSRTCA